jgi:hypothetical protein
MYAFAEPATGGEAFIPKRGDRSRSLGILEKAASWYGAGITTGGRGGVDVRVVPGNSSDLARAIASMLRADIRGGNVASYFGGS